jgi:photosystem II stability/assembly factor-like uncharacterized protein
MLTSLVGFANIGEVVDASGAVNLAAPWLYRTDDGGATWQPVQANLQLWASALDCISAVHCWASTASLSGPDSTTELFETTDGGRSWVLLPLQVV